MTTSRFALGICLITRDDSTNAPQKEAIAFSWGLLTEVYKLPKDRLYVTYFEGDTKNGLAADSEAKQYWLDQGLSEEHVIPGNAKDNFWGKFNGPFSLS